MTSAEADLDSFPLTSIGELVPKNATGCPIRASLGVLGRKWALVVLRDVAFRPDPTFGQILRRSKGLTPRVLSNRLRELRAEELIEKVADSKDDRKSHYRLTAKGKDVVPILVALASFGMKHLAPQVIPDGRPRTLQEIFPGRAPGLLRDLYVYSVSSPRRSKA